MQYLSKAKQQTLHAIMKYLLKMSNRDLTKVLVYIWSLNRKEKK